MRFNEFKTIKEASILSKVNDVASLLNFNPFRSDEPVDTTSNTGGSAGDSGDNAIIGTGSKVTANWSEISNYLATKMDDNHRLGILTNIQAESGFRPGALGDKNASGKNTSGGLFQHHNERFTNMVRAVGSDWATDWKGQIDFALSEPAGRRYLNLGFPSAKEASKWWTINFENPKNAEAHAASRVGLLKNFT